MRTHQLGRRTCVLSFAQPGLLVQVCEKLFFVPQRALFLIGTFHDERPCAWSCESYWIYEPQRWTVAGETIPHCLA